MKHPRPFTWPTERNRLLLICGLSFWAGCGLAGRLNAGPWLWLLVLLSMLMGILLRCLGLRGTAGLALCMLALGTLRAWPCLCPATPEPGVYESVVGYVCGEPRLRSDNRITFTLANVRLDGVEQSGKAYCSLYYGDGEAPRLFDGASLSMSGRVYLPDGKSGAPRFDFRMWMLQNGMSYGIAVSKSATLLNTPETAPVLDWAYRLRLRFQGLLEGVMGDNARFAMAMLLGRREEVSEEEYAAFQRLGVAHVMSVSGLHVGVLGRVLLWLLNRLRLRQWLQLFPMGAFLFAYCAITGFSAATMRASVMLLCLMLSNLCKRSRDPTTSLGAAMLAVLLMDPLQAFSAGFLLSFSAVAGIMLMNGVFSRALNRLAPEGRPLRRREPMPLRRLREGLWRLWGQTKEALCTSLAAQLGVLLPTAMIFHSVPLYGVLVNVPVIVYMSLLMPVYAAALLLSPLPVAGPWMGVLASAMSEGLLGALKLLSGLPYASVRVPSPPALWVLAGMLVLLLASPAVRAGAWRRLAAMGLICAVAGSAAWAVCPPGTRYVQLAVGQADAALLFAGDQTVAIDVGADGSAVIDYLMDSGRDLDALVLTHLHLDHAGGVSYVLEAGIGVKRAYLPVNAHLQRLDEDALAVLELLKEARIPITFLARGDELSFPGASLRVLWPDGHKVRRMQDTNDLPLVLAVELGGYTLLNASDLTGSYERYAAAPCDVLKVAHHGSGDSTGDEFLALAQPRVALLSCSSGSRSLPDAETLKRLEAHGIPMLRTDAAGDITLWVQDERLMVAPYKAGVKE